MSKYLDENGLAHLWDSLNKKNTLGIEFISGTQTAATNAWTGVTKQSALYDGMKIAYQLPYAGNSNAATLNLTLAGGSTTGAKAVKRAGTGSITTHYAAGSVIYLVYRTSVNIAGTTYTNTWFAGEDYDSTNLYQDYLLYSLCNAGSNGLKQASIALRKSDGTLESCTTSDGVGTSKPVNTSGFILGELYWYASTTVAANTAVPNNTLYVLMTSLIDYRYTFNSGSTLTANKSIYLVGTISGGLFYLSSPTYWAQDLPTTEDGKVYILLGRAYDTYRGTFFEHHPIYEYRDGAIHEFVDKKYAAATDTIGSVTNWSAGTLPSVSTITASQGIVTFTTGSNGSLPSLTVTDTTVLTELLESGGGQVSDSDPYLLRETGGDSVW